MKYFRYRLLNLIKSAEKLQDRPKLFNYLKSSIEFEMLLFYSANIDVFKGNNLLKLHSPGAILYLCERLVDTKSSENDIFSPFELFTDLVRNPEAHGTFKNEDFYDLNIPQLMEIYKKIENSHFYKKTNAPTCQLIIVDDKKHVYIYNEDFPNSIWNYELPEEITPKSTLLQIREKTNFKYIRISPYINFLIIDNAEHPVKVYLFNEAMKQKENVGAAKFINLFNTLDVISLNCEEFKSKSLNEGIIKTSDKGVTYNAFVLESKDSSFFFDNLAIRQSITEFLFDNESNVVSWLCGEGGVGKTATIQYVCTQLLSEDKSNEKTFDYIIFFSAKNRRYDYVKQVIDSNFSYLKDFKGDYASFLTLLSNFDFLRSSSSEDTITKLIICGEKVLIIIDDFETFSEKDRECFLDLFLRLKRNHKVIITTRMKKNKPEYIINMDKYDSKRSFQFLKEVLRKPLKSKNGSHIYGLLEMSKNTSEIIENVYQLTSGRPLFIYQLAHVLCEAGHIGLIGSLPKLDTVEQAIVFLYDNIHMLLQSNCAKETFCVISLLTTPENMKNSISKLDFVLNYSEEEFQDALDELVQLQIVIRFTEENKQMDLFQIYSNSREIREYMRNQFNMLPVEKQEHFKKRYDQINVYGIDNTYDAFIANILSKKSVYSVSEKVDILSKFILLEKKCPIVLKLRLIIDLLKGNENFESKNDSLKMYKFYKENMNEFIFSKKFILKFVEVCNRLCEETNNFKFLSSAIKFIIEHNSIMNYYVKNNLTMSSDNQALLADNINHEFLFIRDFLKFSLKYENYLIDRALDNDLFIGLEEYYLNRYRKLIRRVSLLLNKFIKQDYKTYAGSEKTLILEVLKYYTSICSEVYDCERVIIIFGIYNEFRGTKNDFYRQMIGFYNSASTFIYSYNTNPYYYEGIFKEYFDTRSESDT